MTTDQTNISQDEQVPEGDRPEHECGGEGTCANETTKLREQLAQAQGDYQRVLADFANYQRRSLQNEQAAKIDGAGRVASDVVSAIDHFDLALLQDLAKATPESLIDGMKLVRDELLKVLARHGVSAIKPQPNDLFTPGRHEAIMQQPAEGITPGHVVATFQTGYVLNSGGVERVIRAAKVSVAPSN